MQRKTFKIERKLLNDLSVHDGRKENFKEVKTAKKTIEIRKFFDGFKRAMKFGLLKTFDFSTFV